MHFLEAVNKLWKSTSSAHPNLKKLCVVASQSAAPQFYITPKHALDKYSEFVQTGVIDASSEVTRDMYRCIFARYKVALDANNGVDFKYSVMQDVLDSPAPSFFITPTAAIKFYYRAMAYKRSLAHK